MHPSDRRETTLSVLGGSKKGENGPETTFIISTYGRRGLWENSIARIVEFTRFANVIIVDDGSDDGTSLFLHSSLGDNPRVVLIKNEGNKGSAFCWNLGIKESKSRFLVFLPDDALELLPGVETFVLLIESSMLQGDIVGIHIVEEERFHLPQGTFRDVISGMLYGLAGQVIPTNDNKLRYTRFVPGVMAIKREVGESISFDDELLIGNAFREESDFQLKAKKLGYRILYNPSTAVRHTHYRRGGQDKKFKERGYAFWALRNQFIFMRRNHLAVWLIRYGIFVFYQTIIHRSGRRTVRAAIGDALQAMNR